MGPVRRFAAVPGAVLAGVLATGIGAATAQLLELKHRVLGSEAIVTADASGFAGSITSLQWNGMEFIDRKDHGRGLQSSVHFDGLGACFNPTEAGTAADGRGTTSSSLLMAYSLSGEELYTKVDAAFWLEPGATYYTACGGGERPDVRRAVNTKVRDGYLIEKRVRFGSGNVANSLGYAVAFSVPNPHRKAQFEIVTAYMPDRFSDAHVFDRAARRLGPKQEVRPFTPSDTPVAFATQDGKYALAFVCPDTGRGDPMIYGYFYFIPSRVTKLSCFKRMTDVAAGQYPFVAQVIFGSLEDVQSTLRLLVR